MVEHGMRPSLRDTLRAKAFQVTDTLSRVAVIAEQRRKVILGQFREIGGNSSLSNARIVGLGESHGSHDRSKIGRFLHAYAKPRDVVLVEGVQSLKEVDRNGTKQDAYQFPRDVHVFGWDNLELVEEAQRLKQEINVMSEKRLRVGEEGDFDQVIGLTEEIHQLLRKREDILIPQRNRSLISALEAVQVVFPNSRVFIIAGALHFTEDPNAADILAQDKYVVLRPK